MKLGDIIPQLSGGDGDAIVTGFAVDHRKIAPGTVFGAFRGTRFNGEDFIPDAVAAGAIAVVCHSDVRVEGACHIASDNPRRTFAELAARFFVPVPGMTAAVTGTNGKTSTAEMTRQLWRMGGFNAASIGTLGVTTSVDQVSTGLTTPDIVTFLANMSGLAREGVTHAIFEASSHGLDQYRTAGLPVKIGAFTNFSRDHLDYHGTMESYLSAKLKLVDELVESGGSMVVWSGDPASGQVIEAARARDLSVITVGPQDGDLRLASRTPTQLGQVLMIEWDGQTSRVNLPLIGAYQAANALVSAAIVLASGEEPQHVFDHLARLQPVRGRLERAVISKHGVPVYVDYAHTPDALKSAIEALRPHVEGRLITIFGAGGDRDRGKRAEMGSTAAAMSDVVIVTDDNPRSEDPAAIRADVMQGALDALNIGDRREAIARALEMAGGGDIILLAGKGHEQGQIIGAGDNMRILPFDDVAVARECAA